MAETPNTGTAQPPKPNTPTVPIVVKPKRARRKNYQKSLEQLIQFCAVSVNVLESLKLDGEFVKGQIAAFRKVQEEAEK